MGKSAHNELVLTEWWEEDQLKDAETVQNMDFFMDGVFQALDNSYHEEKLDNMVIGSHTWLLMQEAQQGEAYEDHCESTSRMKEEFLIMHVEKSHEVELLQIATRNLEDKLNAMFEACNTQHQIVMGSNLKHFSMKRSRWILKSKGDFSINQFKNTIRCRNRRNDTRVTKKSPSNYF
ncbi:hypothetical protein HAX54_001832 [Datura stramonium]|uniref:Uncharacterized protein n=1 Tax=Datura stramonium TaxID=4076 RepID=A0ABS8T461_DATST|nr:hypothetical protein [Datura stramonium]